MENSTDKVSLTEAKKALLRSGYVLESRLEAVLRKKSHLVEANTAYPDPESGKPRELDLYAMTAYKAGPDDGDYIFSVLLIECVNNPHPIAFLTKEPQLAFLHHYEVQLAGLPVQIPDKDDPGAWESLPDYLQMDKYHHYCKGRVATQYCSFTRKRQNQEVMATHDEEHFDSLRKLSSAMEHKIDTHFKNWVFNGRERLNIEFYYPVMVIQGKLIDARINRKSIKLIETGHIQFRRSTIIGKEETTHQIDIVTERHFPRYLNMVHQESTKTARLLRRRHVVVRKAIDKIVRHAKKYRSPDKIRKAMEF